MINIKKDKLEYYLFETLLTIPQIAKEFNTTRWYIEKYMKTYNLKRSEEYNFKVHSNRISNVKLQRSKEEINSWLNKTKQTKLNKYGDENYNNMNKNYNTKLERYGNKNYNNINKQQDTMLKRYGYKNITTYRVYNNLFESPFLHTETQVKLKQTKLKRYGNMYYNNPDKQLKSYAKNKGRFTSKPEKELYKALIKIYPNTKQQYYIKDLKMCFDFKVNDYIIELNGEFYHNYKPFTNTQEDIKEYNNLKQSGPLKSAIADVWRYKDVKKLNYCKENNIKYLVIYYGTKHFKVIDKYNIYANNIEEILTYLKTIL